MILAFLLATACIVTDGDTIRCGDERIRLLAIDAQEMELDIASHGGINDEPL